MTLDEIGQLAIKLQEIKDEFHKGVKTDGYYVHGFLQNKVIDAEAEMSLAITQYKSNIEREDEVLANWIDEVIEIVVESI